MSSFSLCCLLLAACCLLGKRKKFLIQELRGQYNIRFLFTILLLVFVIIPLAQSQEGAHAFRRALPGYVYRFPADHAAHPQFRTEWWYYTGHLKTVKGRNFGFQLTFFRHALKPAAIKSQSRWALHTLYFVHFAITDGKEDNYRFQEKVSRGALDLAGADPKVYRVWVEDWRVSLQGSEHKLKAGKEDMVIDLALAPIKSAVIHGENGVSQKAVGEGYASHYYSLTRMQAKGELYWQGRSYEVEGLAWMDHEFGSNQLRDYQVGWDWFSVQLDNQIELMIYIIRHKDGKFDPTSSGTFVYPDGRKEHLPLETFGLEVLGSWKSRKSATTYPSGWLIRVPSKQLELRLMPTVEDQELTTRKSTLVNYWEGSVRVQGRHKGQEVGGRGYVELTGYDAKFRPDI